MEILLVTRLGPFYVAISKCSCIDATARDRNYSFRFLRGTPETSPYSLIITDEYHLSESEAFLLYMQKVEHVCDWLALLKRLRELSLC